MPALDPAENLKKLLLLITDAYSAAGIKNGFTTVKMTMISSKGGCKLKGTATEVRSIGFVLVDIWKKYWNPKKIVDQKFELCLRTSCHLETLLDKNADQFVFGGLAPHTFV